MQCPSLDEITPAHLSECERCRRQLALQGAMRGKLRQAEGEWAIPKGFHSRLKARLDSVQQPSPGWRWAGRIFSAVGLAACLALALLPWLTRNQSGSFKLSEALAQHHSECWALPENSQCLTDVASWGTAHHNPELPVPLLDSSGLKEKERRICPFADVGKGPHMLLKDPKGRQASLFVLPLDESQGRVPQQPVAYQVGSDTVVLWHGAHWAFGLVSPASQSETLQWIKPALGSDQPWQILAAR
jgi:hypothetical protein